MNKSKIPIVESKLTRLLNSDWFLVWRDTPLDEIPLTHEQIRELRDAQIDCGGYFDKGTAHIEVTVIPESEVQEKPWGSDSGARTIRNARIVHLRDNDGLSFRLIGERVGMSKAGVMYAYKRGKGMPPKQHLTWRNK